MAARSAPMSRWGNKEIIKLVSELHVISTISFVGQPWLIERERGRPSQGIDLKLLRSYKLCVQRLAFLVCCQGKTELIRLLLKPKLIMTLYLAKSQISGQQQLWSVPWQHCCQSVSCQLCWCVNLVLVWLWMITWQGLCHNCQNWNCGEEWVSDSTRRDSSQYIPYQSWCAILWLVIVTGLSRN